MTAAEINDGGPAFPMQEAQAIHAKAYAAVQHIADNDERDRAYVTARAAAVGGMSLRDYFAAHEVIDPQVTFGPLLAERLVGRPMPMARGNQAADSLEVALYWADVEAAYRYLRADAMLKARAA